MTQEKWGNQNQKIFEYIKSIRFVKDTSMAKGMLMRQFDLNGKQAEEFFIEYALQT